MLPCHLRLLLFTAVLHLVVVVSQHSDTGFSYDRIPMRPHITDRTRPSQVVRPITSKPKRRLPAQGGSRYLRRKKPGRKNLDKSLLLELMGDDFQSSWMSDEKPQKLLISVPSNEVDLDSVPGRWAQERLLEQTQELNLTAELSTLQPELLPFVSIIRSWLLKRSSCPVEFSWRDLGPTFWPRWVRKGDCLDRKGSCSFPLGMHCVPAATTTVHILRWQCRDKKTTIVQRSVPNTTVVNENAHSSTLTKRSAPNTKIRDSILYRRPVADVAPEQQKRKKKRCDWYRVPYPITIDCFCTC